MAKFFLTNNNEWYLAAKERITDSDFELAFDYADNNVYALTTHKLKIKNTNAYQDANGDFVIATGTAIYKESLDYTNVLADFSREETLRGVGSIRKSTVGHYVFVIKHKEAITIFCDGVGAYNSYYYYKNGCYLISNSLFDMAKVLSPYITLNEMNLLEYSIQCGVLCNETIFNEISRLGGDEYIEIHENMMSVNSLPEQWNLLRGDATEHVKELSHLLKKKATVISSVLGDPCICMTGGLDSRMSLAAYLSAGARPTLLFGQSNTNIAAPEPMDKEIVHIFSTKFRLKENLPLWDTTRPDAEWKKYLERYGFLFRMWGAAPDIMSSFENVEEKLCTLGSCGELFRNLHLTEHRTEDISIDELIQEYYQRAGKVTLDCEEIFLDHLKNKLLRIAEKYHLDPMHMHPEDITYFYIECRSVADTITMNYLNYIGYSNLMLMETDVVKYCRVPNLEMDDSKYMLKVMYDLYPEILQVPVFSRCAICRFDLGTMTLYRGIDARRSPRVLMLKAVYKKMKTVLKPLRNLYKKVEHINTSKPVCEIKQIQYNKPYHRLNSHIEFHNDNLEIYHYMNIYAINAIFDN